MKHRRHDLLGPTACALAISLLFLTDPAAAISYETLIAPVGVAGEGLGRSVASAGDMNGDGFDDVIIGGWLWGPGYTGRAYVHFGGTEMDTVPDLVFTGEAEGDWFGHSVASAGDVNADGYGDIIVGAAGYNSQTGRAYLFLGGSSDQTPDVTFTGEATADQFGSIVSAAGDVNGDGYDDVLVSAPNNDAGGSSAGRVYVYLGGASMDNVADWILTGSDHAYGWFASTVGDMNGDGFDDIAIDDQIVDWAEVDVFFGGSILDTIPDLILQTTHYNDSFGTGVSRAGDVNGDGYDDLVVGAPYDDTSAPSAGRADVFFGGADPDGVPDLTFYGSAAGDWFGYSTASAGDVDGDGFDDIFVGAFRTGDDQGRAYLFLGGPDADTTADLVVTGEAPEDEFGHWLAGAGDVNGDGLADIVVGASKNDVGGEDAGRAYVFTISAPVRVLSPSGGETWVAGSPATIRWEGSRHVDVALSTDGGFTWSTLANDIGGDENTYSLLVPATPTETALLRLSITGEPITPLTSDVSDAFFRILVPEPARPIAHRIQITDTGADEGDEFGAAVAMAGDVNGDGIDDILVGAPRNDDGAANGGAAHLYVGGADADGNPDLTFLGTIAADVFGHAVAGVGDVNGDGIGDFLVSAPQNDTGGPTAGQAYLYYGDPQLDITDDVAFTGEATGDWLGLALSGAGDMNRDGYTDFAIGAPYHDTGGDAAGRVYLHLGSAIGNATADLILDGEAAGDKLGGAMAPAGDVNGDGYDDLLIAAPDHDAAGSNAGRVYLHLGGASPDATPDLVLDGEASNDHFGEALASAGDMNGDGYDDIAIGAPDNGAAGSSAGRVYVCFGGGSPDAVPDLILTGTSAQDQFGSAVAGVGDVNRDGYDDLLVGAPETTQNEDRPGRVYLLLGGPIPDAIPDYEFAGAAPGDGFGWAVSSGGDFNGDGFHDLLAGARQVVQEGDRPGYIRLYDFNRYHVVDPARDEVWNVGALETIAWLGAEPADVWLSADGGVTHEPLWMGAGGQAVNSLQVRVPHLPSRFASVRITPSDGAVFGKASCDSLFTIDASIVLMLFRVGPRPDGLPGALVSWGTDPGPEELTGYRLEKAVSATDGASGWHTLLASTRETTYHDPGAGPGARYRLTVINGLGEELLLGETRMPPLVPLAARPLPYRGGLLAITFATTGGLGGGAGEAQLSLHDVTGRLVRRIASGVYPAGYQHATWDGRDALGTPAAAGVYFLRAVSGGRAETMKVIVVR